MERDSSVSAGPRDRFDWNDFLTLAGRLAEDGDQASLRSALSRTYYAAFCQARDRMEGKVNWQSIEPKGLLGEHAKIWIAFGHQNGRTNKKISEIGFDLFELRKRADYDAEFRATADMIQGALERTRQLVKLLPFV